MFIVGEGNDYSAIKQSYEIRNLRRDVERLRQQLDDARARRSVDDNDEDDGPPDRSNAKTASRAKAARQRRLRTNERVDNIYFGTPGLANIVSDVRAALFNRLNDTLTVLAVRESPSWYSFIDPHCS